MPIRWLWKNKGSVTSSEAHGSVQTPKVPLVYVSVPLPSIKEETLKTMGFHRLENNGVIWYEKTGEGQWVMFYKDGHATIKDKITGTELEYFHTDDEAITYLKNKYFKTSKSKPKATGEMPYSGKDYQDWWATYWPDVPSNNAISLLPEDTETMKQMGFEKIQHQDEDPDPKYKFVYKKTDGPEMMYFFASGKAAFWKDSQDGPYYYNTVKDGMQMLWDKYMPFIEESFFKDLVNVLMTRPDAAKLLS
jgi:hypothetical protein